MRPALPASSRVTRCTRSSGLGSVESGAASRGPQVSGARAPTVASAAALASFAAPPSGGGGEAVRAPRGSPRAQRSRAARPRIRREGRAIQWARASPIGAALDHVEAAAARRELAERRPRVARHRVSQGIGLEEHPRELCVAAGRGDLNEALRQDPLDVGAVAEGCTLHAHGLQRADEHLARQALNDAGHARDRSRLLVGRARAQPGVHVRDGLVVAVRGHRGQRQLFFEDRARQRVDQLAHVRPQEHERGLRIATESRATRAGHRPELLRRAARHVAGERELGVGLREVALPHRRERERDPGEGNETVFRELRDEVLDLGAQHRRGRIRVAPRLADGLEAEADCGDDASIATGVDSARPPPHAPAVQTSVASASALALASLTLLGSAAAVARPPAVLRRCRMRYHAYHAPRA